MKNLFKNLTRVILITLTIAYILFAGSYQAKAQTRIGQYSEVTTDHFKAADYPHVSSTTKQYKSGLLRITDSAIQIDTATYKIVEVGKWDEADEGMFTRNLTIIYTTKKTKKLMDVVILYEPNKKPLAVLLKRSKATKVTYAFKD